MCDGQQDQQAPKPADDVGKTSQLEGGSLPSMPTKTTTPSLVIVAAITRKIIGAPLIAKDAMLPTPAEFAIGSYEEKMICIVGLVDGLNKFIFGGNNLHKEVIKYSLSLNYATTTPGRSNCASRHPGGTPKSIQLDQGVHCTWTGWSTKLRYQDRHRHAPLHLLAGVHGVPSDRCFSRVLETTEARPAAKARQAPRRTIVVQAALYA
ncbi:unnamed protein product [Trichogramma brassicae]|uniref:Uncharacterized protein n=1 Tax=Trichogramma brassicae TaxID=86971 RepID=A0A6H5IRC0_9HYME|nr:unnamed protein product [Trichogramma brassicae]